MTIEEFREFGWKAGMRVTLNRNPGPHGLLAVSFSDALLVINEDGGTTPIPPKQIRSVINPDGTVAWRKE